MSSAAIDFETQTLNSLDDCIRKMSDRLDSEFDPADKKSMSLFRQFCSALRARVQWVKNFVAGDLPSALKAMCKSAAKTGKSLTAAGNNKNKTAPKKESPDLLGSIKEMQRFYDNEKPSPNKEKINGLLLKR